MNSSRRRSLVLASLSLLTPLFLTTAARSETELARVNGKVITLEDFNRKFPLLSRLYTDKVPTKAAILEDLIKREIGIQEAKRTKVDQDSAVQDEMNTILYQAYLRKNLSGEFDKIVITDTEAKAWYQRNPEIRTSHIFVGAPTGSPKDDEQKAYGRIKEVFDRELKGTKSFAEVAQSFSEGVAAPLGGDIDYKTKEQLDPAYYSAAIALGTVGKTSGIVRTQYGFHIIKLTAIRPWDQVDRVAVKNSLAGEKRQQIFARFMGTLRAKANVSIKSNLLN